MVKLCTAKFEVEGKEVMHDFKELGIRQPFDDHHQFEVCLPIEAAEATDASGLLDFSKQLLGKEIKISIAHRQGASGQEFFFRGLVTGVGVGKGQSVEKLLVVTGCAPTVLLDEGAHTRSFSEKNLNQIVEAAKADLPKNALKLNNCPVNTTQRAFTVQYQESTYNFLRRLANEHGEWFCFDGKELRFGVVETGTVHELRLGQELDQFDLNLQLMPSQFKRQAYNLAEHKTYSSKASDTHSGKLDLFTEKALDASEKLFSIEPLQWVSRQSVEAKQFDEGTSVEKSSRTGKLVSLQGKSQFLGLLPGSLVSVSHPSEKKPNTPDSLGEYRVLGIEHYLDNGGHYRNQFSAIPSKLEHPPWKSDAEYPKAQAQPAMIKENNDPEGLGRVRVRFLWQPEDEMTPWITRTTTLGGDGCGFHIVPEIGELVLVGFEQDHPECPFVLGSLHHGKAKSGFENADNHHKAIRTRSGNLVFFSDEPGKETIRIANQDSKNELVMTLEKGGKISLKTEGQMIFSADSIELEARTISVKADQSLDLEAKDLNVKADMNLDMQGTNVSVEAKTKASLTSKVSVEISGTAEATMKAGIIRLN